MKPMNINRTSTDNRQPDMDRGGSISAFSGLPTQTGVAAFMGATTSPSAPTVADTTFRRRILV